MTNVVESEFRKSFYLRGTRLHSYPIAHEVKDQQQITVDQLAYEHGCHPREIGIFLEECAPKRWDFSRDCWYEHIGTKHGLDQWRILSVVTGRIFTFTGPLYEFVEKYEAGEAEAQHSSKPSAPMAAAHSTTPHPYKGAKLVQRACHPKRAIPVSSVADCR